MNLEKGPLVRQTCATMQDENMLHFLQIRIKLLMQLFQALLNYLIESFMLCYF